MNDQQLPLGRLAKKLRRWDKIRNTGLAVAVAAAILTPACIWGIPAMLKLDKQKKQEMALRELCAEPIPRECIEDIIKESLDDAVTDPDAYWRDDSKLHAFAITDEHKKHMDIINPVSARTGVPKYVLAAFIDYADLCMRGRGAMCYSWDGFVQVTGHQVGVDPWVLMQDKEQCLLSMAYKYKLALNRYQNELVALAMSVHTTEDNVSSAKDDAKKARKMCDHYREWRKKMQAMDTVANLNGDKAEGLVRFDALVAKYRALSMNQWKKRSAVEDEVKALFAASLPNSPPRTYGTTGTTIDREAYRVALHPVMYRRHQWWVNHVGTSTLIKNALRFKRDGLE
jgi:hypothetical protein